MLMTMPMVVGGILKMVEVEPDEAGQKVVEVDLICSY